MEIRKTIRLLGLRHQVTDSASLKTSNYNVYVELRRLLGLESGVLPKWALYLVSNPGCDDKCKVCGSATNFNRKAGIFFEVCSSVCAAKTNGVKEKRHRTMVARYGDDYRVTNAAKARATTERKHGNLAKAYASRALKTKATCLEKYGVPNPAQVPEVRTKIRQAIEKIPRRERIEKARTGSAWRTDLQKALAAKEKYTATIKVRTHSENLVIVNKRRRTTQERYGVLHHYQDSSIYDRFQKTAYRTKEVTINKEVYRVQGYEGVVMGAISHQVKRFVTKPSSLPEIWYRCDGMLRRYYADFGVISKSGNRYLVEVKSSYTLNADLHKNLQKFKAANNIARKFGFTFVLSIADAKGVVAWIPSPSKSKIRHWIT